MNAKKLPTPGWGECPPGTLAAFAAKERGRQRRRLLAAATSAAAVCLVFAGLGYLGIGYFRGGEPNFGGVTCSVVRAQGADFMAGKLEAKLAAQIKQHLEQCSDCQRVFREMSGGMMTQVSFTDAPLASTHCECGQCLDSRSINRVVSQPAQPETAPELRLALSR